MSLTKKEASSKQEHRIAAALGWKVTSGSGARAFYPGDVSSDVWLGECKTHVDLSPVLFYFSVWEKICDEAASQFKRPVLFIDNGSQQLSKTWCILNTVLDYDGEVCDAPSTCINAHTVNVAAAFFDRHRVYRVPGKDLYIMPFEIFQEHIS